MKMLYLVVAILFSLFVALFAMANSEMVTVNYLFGAAHVSLIVLILGSACAGIMVMWLFSLFGGVRTALKFREVRLREDDLKRRLEELEREKKHCETELIKLMTKKTEAVTDGSPVSQEEESKGKAL